jgi:hypothetical protein
MTMVPIGGMISSAAGTALSQSSGTDTERTQKDVAAQFRSIEADQHAADSAGIGKTGEDQQTSERDADGRRLWEKSPTGDKKKSPDAPASTEAELRQSKDPTGQSGTRLDLTG